MTTGPIQADGARPRASEAALRPEGPPWEHDVPAIRCRHIRVAFGDQPALRGIDLGVAVGDRVAVLGPNGAGKTTLIRVLAGLLRPMEGEVLIGGRPFTADPAAARRRIGFVGHHSYAYPELTLQENLEFYGRLYGVPRVQDRARALLSEVGLYERRSARAGTLSRGMLQRVSLARAVLHDPPILLLDEPDAGLDAQAFDRLAAIVGGQPVGSMEGLGSRADRDGPRRRTVLLTTHDLAHALRLCDHIVILDRGRIVDRLPTDDLDLSKLRERYADATAPRRDTTASARGHCG